jgi:hypothetical protein
LQHDGYETYVFPFKNENPKDQIVDVSLTQKALAGLEISSDPEGVTVWVNGKESESPSPLVLKDFPIPQVVELKFSKAGYEDMIETVALIEAGTKSLHVKLKSLLQKFNVAISSTPVGARVLLDGKDLGQAPVTQSLVPGKYKVEVAHDGFAPQTRVIEVTDANRIAEFHLIPLKKSMKEGQL